MASQDRLIFRDYCGLQTFRGVIVVSEMTEQKEPEPVAFARFYFNEKPHCGVQQRLRGGISFIDEPFNDLD